MLDLLIKSHWYKCRYRIHFLLPPVLRFSSLNIFSVTLEGAHLGITLDDDIDIITSQGDTDINIPSDVPTGKDKFSALRIIVFLHC